MLFEPAPAAAATGCHSAAASAAASASACPRLTGGAVVLEDPSSIIAPMAWSPSTVAQANVTRARKPRAAPQAAIPGVSADRP